MGAAIQNKHQQRTEETRRRLLEAALRVFTRDGFEASRLEDIAAEAGHTRGAFYANFATKEELFLALLEQEAASRIKQLEKTLEACASLEHRKAALRAFFLKRAADRQWAILTLEFKLFALRHRSLRTKIVAAHQRIRASLNLETINKLLPLKWRTPEIDKVILEVVRAGLALEHAYDPKRVSQKQALEALGRIFDFVMT
jgi:AcrR family transcriptional regulator